MKSITPETENETSAKLPLELSNKWYDRLRWAIHYLLPAIGTLYFTLSQLWGVVYFPAPDKVIGTVTAVTLFLSLVTGISKRQYQANTSNFDGTLYVDESNPDKDKWTFEVVEPLDEAKYLDKLSLRVLRTR